MWENFIFPEESNLTVFRTIGRVYVWRHPKVASDPDSLLPAVKQNKHRSLRYHTQKYHTNEPRPTFKKISRNPLNNKEQKTTKIPKTFTNAEISSTNQQTPIVKKVAASTAEPAPTSLKTLHKHLNQDTL